MFAEAKAKVLLLTALDEIAWLFNLRGSDVSYNPVFLSYATVSGAGAKLFVDEAKVWHQPTDVKCNIKALLYKITTTKSAGVRKMMRYDTAMPDGKRHLGHEIYWQPN